jgi:hypothetical protein
MVAYGNIFLPRPSRLAVLDLRAKAASTIPVWALISPASTR